MAGGELRDWRQTLEGMLESGQVSCDDARRRRSEDSEGRRHDLTVKHQRLLVELDPHGLSHDEKSLGQDCDPGGSRVQRGVGDESSHDADPSELGDDLKAPSANDNQVRSRDPFGVRYDFDMEGADLELLGRHTSVFARGVTVADRLDVIGSELSDISYRVSRLFDEPVHYHLDERDCLWRLRRLQGWKLFSGSPGVYEFVVGCSREQAKRARLATKPMGHCALNVSLSKSSSLAAMHRTPSPPSTSCAFCTTVRCGRGP